MPDPASVDEIDRRAEAVATWLRFATVDLAAAETLLAADRDDLDPWIARRRVRWRCLPPV